MPYFGTNKAIYFEDNEVTNLAATGYGTIDCYQGGRYVARYNIAHDSTFTVNHGLDTGGRTRSINRLRFTEIITISRRKPQLPASSVVELDLFGATSGRQISGKTLEIWRSLNTSAFTGGSWVWQADTKLLDCNATESDGTYNSANWSSPHRFYSGTCTQDASGGVMTDSAATFPDLTGYALTNAAGAAAQITSSTAHTITYIKNVETSAWMSFTSGDAYSVYKPLVAIDQPGRGQGDLMANQDPTNTNRSNVRAWPRQKIEPVYSWLNFQSDGTTYANLVASNGSNVIQENRDFYNQTTSFHGTVGVGSGLLADRPSTCTPGTDVSGVTSEPT